MRKSFVGALVAALISTMASVSYADTPPPAPGVQVPSKPATSTESEPRHKWGGVDLFCGVPAGCGGGMMFRPLNWLKLEVGAGYNLMAPGVFGAITLDPMPWAFGLTLTGDAGHYWSGPVPFVQNPPNVEYSFLEALGGLEFGPRNSWRFYFRGGITYLDATVSNFSTNNPNTTMGAPRITGWAAPAAKFGISIYF